MKIFILTLLSTIICLTINGQEFNKSINKDSLLIEVTKDLPEDIRGEIIKTYNSENEQSKEFLLFILSMPKSSKKELIDNLEQNREYIMKLKSEYSKLVPDSLIVFIEFDPENNIVNKNEEIDLRILRKLAGDETEFVKQEWGLGYDSSQLKEILEEIGWDNSILSKIKKMLDDANCISIENDEDSTIGFARSGMGKYSYKILKNNLDKETKNNYNDGCHYIYYKDNIVLEYGGGAIGSQCFPDR